MIRAELQRPIDSGCGDTRTDSKVSNVLMLKAEKDIAPSGRNESIVSHEQTDSVYCIVPDRNSGLTPAEATLLATPYSPK